MTPAARVAAAAEILDEILSGRSAEKSLTNWARRHRFAGSGDRAAIRDHVFDALRCRRSFGWLGQGESGRALMIGALRANGTDPSVVFTGEGYAPEALSPVEACAPRPLSDAPPAVQLDCPDWLWPRFEADLGTEAQSVLSLQRSRAPIFLRVNAGKSTIEEAQGRLLSDDIGTERHALSETALLVTRNPRRVHQSRAYLSGLVELQDAASQAVIDRLAGHAAGKSVLDYCAGGGGKSLALVAAGAGDVTAHDAFPRRMSDIPERARRAGARIAVATAPEGTFDLVLSDVPCSGSGAWRRQPEAKWALTAGTLSDLNRTQDAILAKAALHVAPEGVLAYVTCSLFSAENEDRIAAFLTSQPDWQEIDSVRFSPIEGGDGFFLSLCRRKATI